ncbi:hypothetical protein GCM10023149_12690 [Mucilaginibacter gynuensis]|uniref:Uncharacterized protein n=1 Tax=Mucilaginibacter gynuensis TaxID=1302236 RepID=A0ABP8G2Z5_9SPHI
MGIGIPEILIIAAAIALIIGIGNYGRNTVFGYWGSVLLALFTSPIVAFIILYVVKTRTAKTGSF